MNNRKKTLITVILSALLTTILLCASLLAFAADAEEPTFDVTAASVRMVDGNYDAGIRFQILMDKEMYTEGMEAGAKMIPKKLLAGGSIEAGNDRIATATVSEWKEYAQDTSKMEGIVYVYNIPASSYGTDLVIAGYAVTDSGTRYSAEKTFTLANVAQKTVEKNPDAASALGGYYTFNVKFGDADPVAYEYGQKIAAPALLDGELVAAWTNSAGTAVWDSENMIVTGNTVLKRAAITLENSDGKAKVSGTQSGSNFEFKISANAGGYYPASVTAGGASLTAENGVYSTAIVNKTLNVEMTNVYPITFVDDADNVLETLQVTYGQVPNPKTPALKYDNIYAYSFTGWDKELSIVTEAETYTANYNKSYYVNLPSSSYLNNQISNANWDVEAVTSGFESEKSTYGFNTLYKISSTAQAWTNLFDSINLSDWGEVSFYAYCPSEASHPSLEFVSTLSGGSAFYNDTVGWSQVRIAADGNGTYTVTWHNITGNLTIERKTGLSSLSQMLLHGTGTNYIYLSNLILKDLKSDDAVKNTDFTQVIGNEFLKNHKNETYWTLTDITDSYAAELFFEGYSSLYNISVKQTVWNSDFWQLYDNIGIFDFDEINFRIHTLSSVTSSKFIARISSSTILVNEQKADAWYTVRLVKNAEGTAFDVYVDKDGQAPSTSPMASITALSQLEFQSGNNKNTIEITNLITKIGGGTEAEPPIEDEKDVVTSEVSIKEFLKTQILGTSDWYITNASGEFADKLSEYGYSSLYRLEALTSSWSNAALANSINISEYDKISWMFYVPSRDITGTYCSGVVINTGSGAETVFSSTGIEAWHTVELVKSGSTYNLLIDGVQKATGINSIANFRIEPVAGYVTYYTNPKCEKLANKPAISGGLTDYKLVYDASNNDKKLAGEFIAEQVLAATGAPLSKALPASWSIADKYIIIGDESLMAQAGVAIAATEDKLGFKIARAGNSVFIIAEQDYIYQEATLVFLEEFLGMEYIRNDLVYYNKDDGTDIWNLPTEDITGTGPALEIRRDPSNWELSKDNYYGIGSTLGSEVFIPLRDASGNQVVAEGGYGDGMFHTSFYYIAPSVYGTSNPEYFSEDKTQLCYTGRGNAATLAAMQEIVANKIVERALWDYDKNRNIIVFGAQDIETICTCDACQAVVSKYGSISAANIIFTNGVGELVKEKLTAQGRSDRAEELVILFFAYQNASTPPEAQHATELQLTDNVGVYIASSKSNYAFTFEDVVNEVNATEIENWAAFTDNLYFWLYNYNTTDYFIPVNTFESTQANIQFVIQNGAKMLYFESASSNVQTSGFTSFKHYLEAQLMRDPSASYEEIMNTFFEGFYGQGSAMMLDFYNAVVAYMNTQRNAGNTAFYGNVIGTTLANADYWSLENVLAWITLCDEALAALDVNDPNYEIYAKNIKIEQLFPRWLLARFGQSSAEYQEYEGFQGKKYAIGSKTEFKLEKLTAYRLQFAIDCYELGVVYANDYTRVDSYYDNQEYHWNILDDYNNYLATGEAHTYTGEPTWSVSGSTYTATYKCDTCDEAPKTVVIKIADATGKAVITHIEDIYSFKFSVSSSAQGYTVAAVKVGTTVINPVDGVYSVSIEAQTITVEMAASYEIKFLDDNGSVLETLNVPEGTVPTPATPISKYEGEFVYEFAGWDRELTAADENTTYTATYTKYEYVNAVDSYYKDQKSDAASGVFSVTEITDEANAALILAKANGYTSAYSLDCIEFTNQWSLITLSNGSLDLSQYDIISVAFFYTDAGKDLYSVGITGEGNSYTFIASGEKTEQWHEITFVKQSDGTFKVYDNGTEVKSGITATKGITYLRLNASSNRVVYSTNLIAKKLYVEPEIFDVTLPTGEGYTVSGNATATERADYTFSVAVDEGYTLTEVTVNGSPVTLTDGSYTITNVSAAPVIEVTVEKAPQGPTVSQVEGNGFLQNQINATSNWTVTDVTSTYTAKLETYGYTALYHLVGGSAQGWGSMAFYNSITLADYDEVSFMVHTPGGGESLWFNRRPAGGAGGARVDVVAATTQDSWYKIELVKQSDNTFSIFVDGTQKVTGVLTLSELEIDPGKYTGPGIQFTNLKTTVYAVEEPAGPTVSQVEGNGFLQNQINATSNWTVTDVTSTYATELATQEYNSLYNVAVGATAGWGSMALTNSITLADYDEVSFMIYATPEMRTVSLWVRPSTGRAKVMEATLVQAAQWIEVKLVKQADSSYTMYLNNETVATGMTVLSEIELDPGTNNTSINLTNLKTTIN